jgi:hypothetical protein
MKRFRLSRLMLLIVIAALGIALVVQYHRATRRQAELMSRYNHLNIKYGDQIGKSVTAPRTTARTRP